MALRLLGHADARQVVGRNAHVLFHHAAEDGRTLAPGEVDRRTGRVVSATPANWTAHPNNPMRVASA